MITFKKGEGKLYYTQHTLLSNGAINCILYKLYKYKLTSYQSQNNN